MGINRNLISYSLYIAFLLKCVLVEGVDYNWVCEDNRCIKTRYDPKEPAYSMQACKMLCKKYGLLWPRPTGETDLGNYFSKINLAAIDVRVEKPGQADDLMQAAAKRFKDIVALIVPEGVTPKTTGKTLIVYLVNELPDVRDFSLDMKENYVLKVSANNNKVNATIVGGSFFGVRHGLETLAQLFLYDDIRNHSLIVRDVSIVDKPIYPYRGLLLDTSRNYYTIESIKRTIDAMGAVKLNTFHWHITDTESFPFVSERRPELSRLGAYSPSKIYTKAAISEVVQFARERGVRVLPEFDAPAHVGEGWQDTGLTVCFKADPRDTRGYCDPPCGQLNPARDELYDVLEDIYTDMSDVFKPDIFHMGGDEVSKWCWESSEEIREFMMQHRWELQESSSYLKLWDYFQRKAQERVYKAFGKKLPLILWTSALTDYAYVEQYVKKEDYIIQVWTTRTDRQVKGLLQKGYRLIMSNYDALYLDCGFGAWVGSAAGNNWCSPYIGWKKVYDNSPAAVPGYIFYGSQILGGEAALWSEQTDSATLDGRVWPRAAALAERLWAEPASGWQDAEHRMLHTRERLVRMGIQAESIQPEWCYQNEDFCYRNNTVDIGNIDIDIMSWI